MGRPGSTRAVVGFHPGHRPAAAADRDAIAISVVLFLTRLWLIIVAWRRRMWRRLSSRG
jgi:hypothetical protein